MHRNIKALALGLTLLLPMSCSQHPEMPARQSKAQDGSAASSGTTDASGDSTANAGATTNSGTTAGSASTDAGTSGTTTTAGTTTGSGTTTNTGNNANQPLGKRLLIGYWHNFENGSGFVKLSDVSHPTDNKKPKWDIIDVSFAEPKDTSETMQFVPYGYKTPDEFKADMKKVQGWGQKVLISIGGEKGVVVLDSDAKTQNFISSMEAIISEYGFDGFDIDFEGHSLYLDQGDLDIDNPTTPVIANLIKAITALKTKFGANFLITMAPETFFVQIGFNNYGALGGGDNRAGAYLPVIQKLNKLGYLTLLHTQNYNSGPVMGLDGTYRNMGTADFHAVMTEMIINGFQIAHQTSPKLHFDGLKPEQIAIGLPATSSAGNGFTPNAEVQKAFLCIEKGQGCTTPLQKAGGYPGLRGIMTWSINWDRFTNSEFSNAHRAFLDSL